MKFFKKIEYSNKYFHPLSYKKLMNTFFNKKLFKISNCALRQKTYKCVVRTPQNFEALFFI